jgi:Coenzyme PQQ synthesis protein D (PqqD)
MSASPALPERVSAPDDVVWQKVDGVVLLLDLDTGRYHRFDDVATRMWEALDESPDVATAVDRLAAVYDVDVARLRKDLAALIARLVDTGLLRVDA